MMAGAISALALLLTVGVGLGPSRAAGAEASAAASSAPAAAPVSPSPPATFLQRPVGIGAAVTAPSPPAPPAQPMAGPTPATMPAPYAHSAPAAAPIHPPLGSASRGLAALDHSGISEGQLLLEHSSEAEAEDPLNWSVMVSKWRHVLRVYYKGHLYKSYRAVFGRSQDPGTKLWAGDRRTPEGVYNIIKKFYSPRWRRFLKLNYPNDVDRARYDELRAERLVPRVRGGVASEGNAIGIHGTDQPVLNAGDINWTTGCISVDNAAVLELYALLPIGTLVVINP